MSTHIRTVIVIIFFVVEIFNSFPSKVYWRGFDTSRYNTNRSGFDTHLTGIRHKLRSVQNKVKSFRRKSKLEEISIQMK